MVQVDAFTFTSMASLMPHYTIDDGNHNKLIRSHSQKILDELYIYIYVFLIKWLLNFLLVGIYYKFVDIYALGWCGFVRQNYLLPPKVKISV